MPYDSSGNPILDPSGSGYNQGDTYQWINTNGTNNRGAWVQGPSGSQMPTGDGWWVKGQDLSNGTQRAKAVGQYSQQIMGRQGPQVGAQSQAQLAAARGDQTQALGLMRNMAQGNGPSVAQAQTYGNLGSNIAAMNAGSQARPGAGAMMAGYNAGNQAANQGAAARSGEQANLMSAYGKGATGLNANDITQYGADVNQGLRAQSIANQQGILNANTVFGVQGQEAQNELANESFQQAAYQQGINAGNQQIQQTEQGAALAASTMGAMASDFRLKRGVIRPRGIMDF